MDPKWISKLIGLYWEAEAKLDRYRVRRDKEADLPYMYWLGYQAALNDLRDTVEGGEDAA